MRADVTALLARMGEGDPDAFDALVPLVYDELRQVAQAYMARERRGHTLQATALVHEAFLRLGEASTMPCEDRSHLLRLAARAMRRILIDHARERGRQKRGGATPRFSLDDVIEEVGTHFGVAQLDVLALHEALDRLEVDYPRQARVVELLFFAGLSHPEVAEVLAISRSTVDRDWSFARVWLIREMEGSKRPGPRPE